MTEQPEREQTPDDGGEPTQEIDMSEVFATDRLINDLVTGQVPPDDLMASVLSDWRKQVGGPIPDELGDPAIDMWAEAMQRARERAGEVSLLTVIIEFIAGVQLVAKALTHLVKIVLSVIIRVLAKLPWKQPRPWE